MKFSRVATFAVALAIIAVGGFVLVRRGSPGAQAVRAIYAAPIAFYGKVQDQFGKPVPGARVLFSAVDKFWEEPSQYTGSSDADGLFSINKIRGAGLTVSVSKIGYDGLQKLSSQTFGYGMGTDSSRKAPPAPDAPAVFVLRKKADAQYLIHVAHRQYKVRPDGTPMQMDLLTGNEVPFGTGNFQVERWIDSSKDVQNRFDWRCRISVPNGGLVVRDKEVDFDAPEDGYQPYVDLAFPKSLGRAWQYTKHLDYFAKLSNGSFARVSLTLYAGHTNFLVMDAYVNPAVGSRNLEFDAAKQTPVVRN